MNAPQNSSASSLEDLDNIMDNPEFASLSLLSDPHLELSPNLISPVSFPEYFPIPLPPDSPPELPPLPPSEDFPLHEFEELVIEDDQNKEAEETKRKGKEKVQDNSSDSDSDDSDDDDCKCTCKPSRIEIKSRKAMLKLGLQPVQGVTKVTFRRKNNVFAIPNPDVFKNRSSTTYVIFGEISIEDTSSSETMIKQQKEVDEEEDCGKEEDDEDEDEVEVEVDERDIELIVRQTGISWTQAAKELMDANNDIITVIMNHMAM